MIETTENKLRRKEKDYFNLISRFTQIIFESKSLDDILKRIINDVVALLNFEDCVIYLLDPFSKELVQKAAYGNKSEGALKIKDPLTIKIGEGIVGSVFKTGVSELINDTSLDDRYLVDDVRRFSELTVPLIANNRVIGVIDSEHSQKNFFTERDKALFEAIAKMAALKIQDFKAIDLLHSYYENLEREVDYKTLELKTAFELLESSNEQMKQFHYYISHDLKEPLRNISTYLTLIKRAIKKGENLDEITDFIDEGITGAARLNKMISDVYNYAIVDEKEYQIDQFLLDDLIFEVKHNLKDLVNENSAEIVVNSDIEITSKRTLLSIVFQNLITNAINYKRNNELPVVVIDAIEFEDKLQFVVQDNGRGIEAEKAQEIFGLFSRANYEVKGSGIGLATCSKIINSLGGKIWVESRIGIGSKFIFSISKDIAL